jgi:hypothetical protein
MRRMNTDTAAQVNTHHALRLCIVRHKYAASIAAHARAMERHAHMLVRLHARINTESIAIYGPAYEEYHTVGFDANGSIAEQQQDTDTRGAVSGADLAEWPMTWPIAQARSPPAPSPPAPLRVRSAGRILSERGAAAPFCNEALAPSPARAAVSLLVYSTRFRLRFPFTPALAFTPRLARALANCCRPP